ncbi:SERTA domain-containing protein 3 [Paramarasmius palmivorus]
MRHPSSSSWSTARTRLVLAETKNVVMKRQMSTLRREKRLLEAEVCALQHEVESLMTNESVQLVQAKELQTKTWKELRNTMEASEKASLRYEATIGELKETIKNCEGIIEAQNRKVKPRLESAGVQAEPPPLTVNHAEVQTDTSITIRDENVPQTGESNASQRINKSASCKDVNHLDARHKLQDSTVEETEGNTRRSMKIRLKVPKRPLPLDKAALEIANLGIVIGAPAEEEDLVSSSSHSSLLSTAQESISDLTSIPTGSSLSFSIVPQDAKAWFQAAFEYLKDPDLGDHYESFLYQWVRGEASTGWKKTPKGMPGGRPKVLESWISKAGKEHVQRYTSTPVLDLQFARSFPTAFLTWWRDMQPSWRSFEDGSFQPPAFATFGTSWVTLNRWGPNGWALILVCLKWWGGSIASLAESKAEADISRLKWELAIADMSLMFEGVTEHRIGTLGK